MITQPRVLPLSGVHNFRDYGGYALAGGGRMVSGRLWRSGQHIDATADDLAEIDRLDLATVIDLRGNSERSAYPCARSAQFAADVRWFDGETAGHGGAVHQRAASSVRTQADAEAAMQHLYTHMPHRPNLRAILTDYFETLAAPAQTGGHLVHCYAGKDRTGFAVALLHALLGVHRDDVMADYMLTATAGDNAARVAAGAKILRQRRPEADEEAIITLMGVAPAWLDAAFATLDADFGGLEPFVRDQLGVDRARRDALVAALTL